MSAQTHTAARAQKLLRRKGALTPLILVMGFIGASLRYLLECALPANGGFPAATLVINIFGCFVLELVNQYVGRRMHLPGALVKSLGVGLVGAFTTISAFSTECLAFLQAGKVGLWAAYIVATLATTFLASLAGHAACRGLDARPPCAHRAAPRSHPSGACHTPSKGDAGSRQGKRPSPKRLRTGVGQGLRG